LSRDYGRDIHRLDQVPDEELDRIAAAGFTGLWLIGLWERSTASRTIKHMRGDPDAVASAYALYDYVIAEDLGGEGAYENLRNRAWDRGVRLASDMVPNHVGIDGRWVIDHPHWFLSLDEPPYPGYSFTGVDLCPDDRVTVQIEDHYWDGTDAAVVFKRYDHQTGETKYIYHGNDGTAMPWNDTAQLNYLDAEVREGVIQTILHVARQFPIIRFDAAMTLAKRHIRRLWFPAPGEGGAIPSRSLHGLTGEEFEAAIPEEFWREVVDRVAAEVPDTLLLAEAFWMMEGYFVRTLGMHRVYNSAFMHMLAQETNSEYRQLMKNVLEFDPEIMKRFVNFMNNPDEETAIAQFGKEGKYFGVATVMATLPGLPMFGHGQVEGYSEKYGMEFRRPRWDEYPDQWLVDRHRREIYPLLHRRWQFAEVSGFLLYDLVAPEGHVNEDVYAYSNSVDEAASLVLFHNKWGDAVGRIHHSLSYRDKGAGEMRSRTLAEGLGLGPDDWVVYREHVSGLEYLRPASDFTDGLEVRLGAFEYRVYLDFRQVSGPEYAKVAERLGGAGAESIDAELEALRLEPVRSAAAAVVSAAMEDEDIEEAVSGFIAMAGEHGFDVDLSSTEIEAAFGGLLDVPDVETLLPESWQRGVVAAVFLRDTIIPVVADTAIQWGFERSGETAPFPDLLDVAMQPFDERPEGASRLPSVNQSVRLLLRGWSDEPGIRQVLGVNEHDGADWFDRDLFHQLVSAMLATGSL
ncbi:MAG: hypothetical protein HKN01_05385, partial [Acidimicrobiia bacterium]|nr:hypothetical protein [Acidimicrobiia bacterium]